MKYKRQWNNCIYPISSLAFIIDIAKWFLDTISALIKPTTIVNLATLFFYSSFYIYIQLIHFRSDPMGVSISCVDVYRLLVVCKQQDAVLNSIYCALCDSFDARQGHLAGITGLWWKRYIPLSVCCSSPLTRDACLQRKSKNLTEYIQSINTLGLRRRCEYCSELTNVCYIPRC